MRFFFWLAPSLAFIQIDFNVSRGTSGEVTHVENFQIDNGDYGLTVANSIVYYMSTVELGSDKQSVEVMVDIEGSAFWVPSSDCRKSSPFSGSEEDEYPSPDTRECAKCGTFNTNTSLTYQKIKGFDIYQPLFDSKELIISGEFGFDQVSVGGNIPQNLTFATCRVVDSEVGVLGIGTSGATVGISFMRNLYESLPSQLKSKGLISNITYALWLEGTNASYGSILIGAVDHSKYTGKLQTVKTHHRLGDWQNEIVLDAITGTNLAINHRTTVKISTTDALTALPEEYVSGLGNHLGGIYKATGFSGLWMVPCDLVNSDKSLSFHFTISL